MADLQALFHTVDELTDDELKQLYRYITETRTPIEAELEQLPTKPRVLGLFEHVGKTWMSDDFTAELPDSFWIGEDEAN